MKRPEPWEVIFSAKAFLAAMIALYIAYKMDLPRPYWSLTTAYVVSQPFAASSFSKGLFRIGGTVVGASVAVALGAVFGADEVFMLIALISWFCFCGYFALLDRTPRSYFFLLAGMTAVLVGWPGAASAIFDTGLARVEEIGLGILCTVLVHSLILPRPIAPTIHASLDGWVDDARRLIKDTLSGQRGATDSDRQRLAADASRIGILVVHLRYDSAERRQAARWIEVLQQRMLMLLPVTASIEERIALVSATGRPVDELDCVLGKLVVWIDHGAPRAEVRSLRQAIGAMEPAPGDTSWAAIQLTGLIERLQELLSIASDCRDLRQHLSAAPGPVSKRLQAVARRVDPTPHKDPGMALWSIAGALAAAAVAALFWYMTGWSLASGTMQIALLMCLFLGATDDLRPALRSMVYVLAFAIILDGFYMFVLMPRIEDFPVLVLALAPALLPLGMLGANPATIMIGLMPIAMLTVSETASTDIASFANGLVATEVGVLMALAVTSIVRLVGVEVSARRILKAGWRDLRTIAIASGPTDRAKFASRMLDRVGLLEPRLAALPGNSRLIGADALADLRLGLDLIELQRRKTELTGTTAAEIEELLRKLAGYFKALHGRATGKPAAAVLPDLDRAITTIAGQPGLRHRRSLLLSLGGIRQSLAPDAPDYDAPRSNDLSPIRLAAE